VQAACQGAFHRRAWLIVRAKRRQNGERHQALDRFHNRFNNIKLTGSRKPWAMSARDRARVSRGVKGLGIGLGIGWGAGRGEG
jgi:hypothetical protein